uniref:Reelin n=1 Tax=Fundulus heteroclitus TaxID=8078 RepID=A0A3Q2U7U2_FUNHE
MAAARASLGGLLGCLLLRLALGSSNVDFGTPPASFYPRFNPFFFLCTHHAEMEGAGVAEGGGEVLLTLQITGNPTTYTPGQEYQVTVSTSVPFDGLLVTGLYTSTPVQSAPIPAPAAFGFGVIPERQFAGTQFVCSVVASHVSHQPSTSFSFVWIAPPPGTGCVNFLATATHRGQIIFKDALAQQLCEQGGRSECSNCEVGEQCGVLMHGRGVTFCEHFGERELTTVPLNTSTASVLQFALGSGSCRFSYSDPSIAVSYCLSGNANASDDWITLEKIKAPTNSSTVIHLVPLPHSSRGEAVRLRWSQETPHGPEGYESCWGLDNVLLVNSAHRVTLIDDNLDPLDTANWLFFPGATIKHACQSEGNALYFHGGEGVAHSFASTRDIDLHREEGRSYWEEDFESPPLNWDIEGAMYGTKCGEIESGAALVFEREGRRRVCTPYLDTTSYGNLRFHFTMGGGDCDPGESHDNDVVLFGRSEGRRERVVLDTLPYSSYRTPAVVSVALPSELQTPVTQFCLEQRSHGGADRHVWAVDFMQLLPVLPGTHTHVAQFSINLGCGSYQPANSVSLEFSTNLGRSWSLLHTECLPELCAGPHLPHSTIYSSDNYSGWTRISIPLPNAALTETTRFRWKQSGTGAGNMWAIDNVYIGPACLRFCSGRGHCSRTGCKCDPGFSGPACELASQTFPAFLSEGFSSPRLSSYHSFSSLRGAEVSFGCGVLASGKALVFNRDGRRHLVTAPLDSSQARYLQFTLRLGSRSILSSCPAPDQPGEGVLLHYSSDNGITWTLLRHYAYQGFHEPRIVSVELPSGARKFGVQFRWWQPYHSGRGHDVWALDEISMTSVLFNTISLDFSNVLDVTQSLGFYLGNVQPYCQHDWTLSFSGEPSPGFSIRYVETQSMQIGASYSLQFSLVMGCGREPSPHIDTQVRLEFSTNHGLTWHLVKEACLPGMPSCTEYTAPSVYHPSEFKDWRRVTLSLPQKTWSSATRFRWIQNYYGEQDEWGLDDIYIGQQCPNMCHGHGWCDHGHCRCDDGFTGQDCQPLSPLSSSVLSDFESQDALLATWQEVIGGEVVAPDMGCGVVSSGSSLYFSKAGLRQLVSWDLDTEWAEFVQFYLRVGGDWAECNQADSREEGVLLQYSNDGGISWGLIAEMYFTDFTKPRFVHYELPLASKTPSTRFRWWQPLHSGEGYDQWAIDDVIILSEREKHIIPMANPTLPQFCSNLPTILLNIGCESEFSASAPVLLQYSHDAGRTWALVREGCYPGTPGTGICEGSGRELREPTVYNTGDYEQWTRITVVIPRSVAASKTRFRWFQESSVYRDAPPFALDGVYISEPCPNHCGGHGDCISGVCFCDMGYTGTQDSCVPSVTSPTELTEGFEGKLSPLWQTISGGQIGGGCGIISEGKALYFSSAGRREARTAPLDTTNTRLAQFYIRIGSKSLGPTCTRPRSRNEGVVVQFSTNNGIQWQFLRELDFSSFLEPQVVTIELPPSAKTPYTVFRWWQPQQGKHSAQWALDDVLIGMNDSSRTGFHDKFDGTTPLRHNWYRIQGGEITVDCLSLDPALTFNSEKPRYAESWDFEVTGSSFLQFELSMGCSKSTSFSHGVRLEYSTDCGRHWTLITPECVPPAIGCAGYTQSSVYTSTQHKHWRRITVYLPSAANSPRTRFRWIQTHFTPGAEGWALDNVLLAPGCPWMCSGHGLCDNGRCVCDKGYGGTHCVPLAPLPSVLREDFNENLQQETWPEVYGAERGTLSGEPLKSGTALIFKGDGLRMIVSRDLDCSNTLYIQFSFKFITKGVPERSHSVLLQYSVNGGISWLLLDEFYFPASTDTLFLHLPLPASAQTNATRFRLWQPYNGGKKEEVWVLDDLIIDGSSLHKPPMVIDTFEEGPNEENWLFYPGGNTGLYCPYQKAGLEEDESAMVFISSELGEHSITTRDIDVNENTIIQFEINVGCTTESSSAHPVRLEFSRDFGATWHLLVPLCAGGPQPSSLCSTELHPASVYFPGTTHGWRRELIHVGKFRLCGSIRFRWFQGFFSPGSAPPTWALDNVYIGPQCQDMCNGHGACVSGTHCVCDPGFSGPDCSLPDTPNPDFLKEDFEVDAEHFTLLSGGKPSRKCGIMSSGNHLFFSEDGLRMLVTSDMDLSNARFVQFFLRLGCGKAAPDPRSQPVLLQFSVDGGLTWGLLQEFLFSNTSNQARLVALEIPLRARTSATRLRWWQPSENGHFYSPWVIDQVVVGGSASGWGPLEDDFSSIDGRSWLLHPGGTRMPVCGSDGPAFAFIEKSNTRYAVTTDISLGQDAFIQFDFSASCSVTNSCYSVELEYSLDLGLTWQPVVRDCLPTSPDCSSYTLQRILVSDIYNKWGRVTLSIPSYARSPATRFRWFQQAPFDKQQTWALDNLYIGDGCPDMCSGHGRCQQSSCVCDPEWEGEYCDEPVLPLPSQLKDSFSRAPSLSHWHVLTGGKLSSVCGAVASGAALHFSGSCTRQLVTVDLNLTNAEFVQFYFMYGCMIPPSNRNQGVLLEYSLNGGINWHLLTEIFYDLYTKPGFVNVLLPPAARQEGVRVRWWQPQHEGADRSDWALDNVLIAGSDPRAHISDTFGGVALPNHERAPADETSGRVGQFPIFALFVVSVSDHWLFSEDCSVQRFCNSPDGVMVCGNADGREVYAVTHDIVPDKGWVMQFKIAVGCNVPDRPADRQVHVQYSVDFGVTWKYLVPQCLPADPRCGGQVSQPSVFFPADSWKRAVYPLPDSLAETAVRFRFYQQHSDIQWGVENLYIGTPCDSHCGGHGDCLDQRCICDPGFTGPNCYASTALKASLKERFDWEGGAGPQWQVLEGGKPCTDCGVLVEGTALYFGGADARQAVTADLDLRGAKLYWARIGSEDNMTMCHRPTCRKEGVLLDYSTDGGVSWTLLHEMDYLKYVSVRRDYIVLPEAALTNATRLRWWQPFTISSGLATPSLERAQWAIDNILVGGSDINPSTLLDTFDDEGVSHEESWSFYPNAVRTAGFCGNPSFHLYWPNKNQDRTHNILATRELIVQPGYILQFKIVVGCEADTCEDHHSVLLQYRKDARSDSWQLVQSECLPSSVNNVGCSPFQFHESTIYSPVNSSTWTRVTVQLPDHVSSGATQFRWIQKEGTGERHSWGVDNVYIGEACPGLCSGHGYCTSGVVCICDEGYHGDDCSLSSTDLPSSIKDNFESGAVSPESWQLIHGGGVGSGCGQLSPHAHGDSLYFNGCKLRQAVTKPLDLTRASKIMFVLQIGSVAQTDSCNIALDQADTMDRAVLLQYSVNNGVSWHVIAQHQPKDFIKAQRVSYNIPLEARVKGVMLRWWQPRHDGAGHDQWALDHVEVVLTRKQNYMMNFARQTGMRHYYSRKRRALQQQRA